MKDQPQSTQARYFSLRRGAHRVASIGTVALGIALLVAPVAARAQRASRDSLSRRAQTPPSITLGDSRERVRASLGTPALIERLTSLGVEVWSYGGATLSFDVSMGTLSEWTDPRRELRVRFPRLEPARNDGAARPATSDSPPPVPPRAAPPESSGRASLVRRTAVIRLGDSRDAVIATLGAPWAYQRTPDRAHYILAYGRSVIRLDSTSRRVDGWIVRDSALRVSAEDNESAQLAMGVRASSVTTGATGPVASNTNSSQHPMVAPPLLHAETSWRDSDGDGVIVSGERFTVSLDVRNDGAGVAVGVRPTVSAESPSLGARVTADVSPVDIAPGHSQRFTVGLTAATPLTTSEVVLVVGAVERNGFDLSPLQRLRIPARPAGAPHLVVREVRVEDASRDGRITPREIADVFITLVNDGESEAPPLVGRVVHGRDLFLAGGAPDTFSLGAIGAHGSANLSFSLYTNSRASDVATILELTDPARGRVVARLPIALPIQSGGATLAVDVPSVGRQGGTASDAGTRGRDTRAPGVRDSGTRDSSTRDSGARDSGTRDPSTREGASRSGVARATRRPPSIDEVERDIPRAPALRQDAIAVIIGVARYRALPSARYAARDAELVRRYVTQALGVPDDDEHLVMRTDAEASGNELRRLFGEQGWLARHVNENTELIVYFAGHGAPDASGRTPYLLPFDADGAFVSETGFALGTLYDRLARLPARSITVALDACFSGQTRDARALIPGVRPGVLSIEHPALVRRNMAVLAAARDGESASDLPDARHGAFTWYLARALRGEGDLDGDGMVSIAELGRFVERGVARATSQLDRSQHPLTIARDSLRPILQGARR